MNEKNKKKGVLQENTVQSSEPKSENECTTRRKDDELKYTDRVVYTSGVYERTDMGGERERDETKRRTGLRLKAETCGAVGWGDE